LMRASLQTYLGYVSSFSKYWLKSLQRLLWKMQLILDLSFASQHPHVSHG
jgi:hypothetical protein